MAEKAELLERLAEAMALLAHADRTILRRCVLEGETLKSVGESMGYTLNRIYQLRNAAMERLKGVFMDLLDGELQTEFLEKAA